MPLPLLPLFFRTDIRVGTMARGIRGTECRQQEHKLGKLSGMESQQYIMYAK